MQRRVGEPKLAHGRVNRVMEENVDAVQSNAAA